MLECCCYSAGITLESFLEESSLKGSQVLDQLLSYFFFSPTEQRKKYSNSNIIMHETSQYHVQVS